MCSPHQFDHDWHSYYHTLLQNQNISQIKQFADKKGMYTLNWKF